MKTKTETHLTIYTGTWALSIRWSELCSRYSLRAYW